MPGVGVRLDAGTAPLSGGPGGASPRSRGDAARAGDPLPPEIAHALESEGMRVRAARHITTLRSPAQRRATYRIDLEDGRVVKARRLENATVAEKLHALRGAIPAGFTRALACHRSVLLEEWIDGEPVASTCPDDALLDAAGALLAELHATPRVAGRRARATLPTEAKRAEAERRLHELARSTALAPARARRLAAALRDLDPGDALAGIVHTDFCAENMLVDRDGRLRLVDNERLSVDALGFDLGRTWYRWPLSERAWQRFSAAYAARAASPRALEAQTFWRIVAVAGGAAIRLALGPAHAAMPLCRLAALADEIDRTGA